MFEFFSIYGTHTAFKQTKTLPRIRCLDNANPCILVFILQPSIEQPFQNKFTFQIIELAKFDVRT